jgi:hypothetical protein
MSNVFFKLYNFSSLSTCSEGSEVVEFDENIGHVGREEKL